MAFRLYPNAGSIYGGGSLQVDNLRQGQTDLSPAEEIAGHDLQAFFQKGPICRKDNDHKNQRKKLMSEEPQERFRPPFKLPDFPVGYRRLFLILILAAALAAFILLLPGEVRAALGRGLLSRRLYVGLILAFALLVLSLFWTAGQQLDAYIFLLFNLRGYHPRWLDYVMWVATQIGNGGFANLAAIILYLSGMRRLGIEILLGTLTLWLLVELIKTITGRARPFLTLKETRLVGRRAIGRTFPSGHTSQTFFLAAILVYFFQTPWWLSLILYLLASLVGFTRIYIGVHYPRDVMAGAILGTLWGLWVSLIDPFLITYLG